MIIRRFRREFDSAGIRAEIALEVVIECIDGRKVSPSCSVEEEFNRRQRRKPFVSSEFAQARNQRAAAENGHGHAGDRGRLKSNRAGADTSNLPVPTDALELIDRVLAIDVAGRKQSKR